MVQFTTTLPDEDSPVLGNGVEDEIAVDRETAVSNYGDVRIQLRETDSTPWDGSNPSFQEFVGAFDTLTMEFVGLEDGEEYEVRARTETEHVTGAWTTPVSIVTQFPGATNLQATVDESTGEVTLTWEDNADNEDGQYVELRELSTDDGPPTAWTVQFDAGANTETATDTVDAGEYEYRIRPYTEHTDSVSNTATTFRPTQIPDIGSWSIVLPDAKDDETNVTPRVEAEVLDANKVDAVNRFAREAEAEIWDPKKEKLPNYSDYVPVELWYDGELNWGGFVIEQEYSDSQTNILLLSHDFWLKKQTVVEEFVEQRISDVLESLIASTPLVWNPDLVEVGDDIQITEEYRGETLNAVINDLAETSVGEEFGATNQREFFFRTPETSPSPIDFTRGRYLSTNWDDDSRREVNQVKLYYADGDRSVKVDGVTEQQSVGENVGSNDRVIETVYVHRPEITTPQTAERRARAIADSLSGVQVGRISTWSAQELDPGMVTEIVDPENDIDGEYVIAEVDHEWAEAEITVAQNTAGVNDILADLSEDVDRQDLKAANTDDDEEQIITLRGNEAEISVSTSGFDRVRLTNLARTKIRDGWRGEGTITVSEIVAGDDAGNLSRTNTALANQTASASVTETLVGDTGVEYSATLSGTYNELGVVDSDGDLLARFVAEDGVTVSDPTVAFDVSDNSDIQKGVVTTLGQESIRDILADNAPSLPVEYAYGDDQSDPAEGETVLGDELYRADLTNLLIGGVDSQAEWEEQTNLTDPTQPIRVQNGVLEDTQVCFFREGEDYDTGQTGFDDGSSSSDISGADYASFSRGPDANDPPDFGEWDFTVDHTIPGSDFVFWVRHGSNDGGIPELTWTLEHANGSSYTLDQNNNLGAGLANISWTEMPLFTPATAETPDDLEAGTTHTLRVEITNSDGVLDQYQYWVDCVAPIDGRFASDVTFDETTDSNDALSGPEKFPSRIETALTTFNTRREVTEANFDLTANDVSNNFWVELANDGTNYTRINNSQTGSVTFNTAEVGVDVNVNLSRYAADSTTTPSNGDSGQAIDVFNLFANPDAVVPRSIDGAEIRSIIPPGGVSNVQLFEAGAVGGSGNLLTSNVFGSVDIVGDSQLVSVEPLTITQAD